MNNINKWLWDAKFIESIIDMFSVEDSNSEGRSAFQLVPRLFRGPLLDLSLDAVL